MSLKVSLILGLCLLAVFASGERARYDNYRVYKATAVNEAQLAVLKALEGSSDSIMFLDHVHAMNNDVKIVVAPHKLPDFLEHLSSNEIGFELLETDLQAHLEDDDDAQVASRSADATYDWTQYHQLDDTYAWLQSLARDYPGVVTLVEGGKTYQKRSILGIKIDFSKGKLNNPAIFLEAGIHAREWIAPATATYIANQLLTSKVASVRNVAENYIWYIFPHANPDGYVYTHTTDRMWRKTRTPYTGSCFGADPNRNWAFHWNEVGASNNACSDTYAGPRAFSEIETRTLADFIKSVKNLSLYISFHAYSQYLLYPYGHTSQLPHNHKDLKRVFDVALAAMNKRYGTKYTGGNIYDAIYPAAGASVDWTYGVVGTEMAFCYELRPSSNSVLTGFKLPAAQIIPTGEETLDSVVAMIGETKNLGYFNAKREINLEFL